MRLFLYAIGDWLQPDLYIFKGSLAVLSTGAGTDMPMVKQAHINAISGNTPAAAAMLKLKVFQSA